MKPRSIPVFAVALLLIAAVWSSHGQDPDRVEALMTRKLNSSQEVLRGLVTADFESMGRHAHKLHLFSQETDWNVLQTSDYQRLSGDFRRVASAIEKAANEKNLDAASVAYIKLALNCIDCHRHVRDQKTAD